MSGAYDRDSPQPDPVRLTRRRMLRLAATVGVSAPLLTACTQLGLEDKVLIVMTLGKSFEPSGVTIPAGTTVVWHNSGPIRHTATCNPQLAGEAVEMVLPAGAEPWTSGDLYNGQSWEHTFTTAGTYLYICRYHGAEGMVGTISVVAS